MRAIKVRAAQQDLKLKDVIAELLRRGLAQEETSSRRPARRVQLPLVRCARKASPDEEMTPERVAELLLEGDAEWALEAEHGDAL